MESVTIKSCRICLDTKNSDYVSFDDDRKWLKMYQFCFGSVISDKDVPRKLCGVCAKKMKEFAKFKQLAKKSDRLWKIIVNIDPVNKSSNIDSKPSLPNIKDEVIDVDSSDHETDNEYPESKLSVKVEESDQSDHGLENGSIEYLEEQLDSENENTENDDDRKDDDDYTNDGVYKDDEDYVERKKKVYICKKCKSKYKFYATYLNHVEKNACEDKKKKTDLFCGLCDMKTLDHEVLKSHLDKHSKEDVFSCKLCEFLGKDFADMVKHRCTHLPKLKLGRVCYVCDKRFNVAMALEFHYRKEHLNKEKGGWCSVCNKEFRGYKRWRNHERLHRNPNFICDVCGKTFLFRHAIIEHLSIHFPTKRHICDICGQNFSRKRYLKLHQQTVHDEVKVTCTHCNKVYKNQKSLEFHLRLMSKPKDYQCEVCSKRFYTECDMRSHMIWHTDERPYSCDECGSAYKTKYQLVLHRRRHTGYKPYKCSVCPIAFPTSGQLKVHHSVHSGLRRFKCRYCDRSFHNSKPLIAHCEKVHNVLDIQLCLPKKKKFQENEGASQSLIAGLSSKSKSS